MKERGNAMKKIVINKSYEDFSVSHKAFLRLRELGQQDALLEADPGAYWPEAATPREPSLNRCGTLIPRDDEKLVRVVEELRAEANGHCAELKVVSVPDDVKWQIRKLDGVEHVSEVHRTWN
jgi:hypothetical protein